jgi:hypothetical protein
MGVDKLVSETWGYRYNTMKGKG